MESKPKPILTYAGNVGLFTSLAPSLVQALQQESTDWRRSYGRVNKAVRVEAEFVPFSVEILPRENDWQLIKQPIFHIYWTECLDVDLYKTSVRDDIEQWLNVLNQHNLQQHWLIVLVETYDVRKSNKLLPRTTVLDKIRGDFASKQGDRCISVINPVRSESRSAESWRGLLSRIRLLTLTAYNHTLLKFEEAIREQRERRNQTGWCFNQYFLLQEEMAFVLEMLGVYDEALVQYDELDALFTQFVLNCNAGETAGWLSTFQCSNVTSWSGLSLDVATNQEKRESIKNSEASLLDFRCYLFSRQCAMLLLTSKPWEIAQRCLPFLHNCCNELSILDVSCGDGVLACWVFLCCLEVLYTCQRFNDSDQVEAYSLYTASLWAYARDKLQELGDLCGLMPGSRPTSQQLHLVVGLSAGMGDPVSTPTDKLKEALSSSAAFKRQYLELAELAMGTYKHIGRIRSARLIGCDLAAFYLETGDVQKAVVFYNEALRMFEEEKWIPLAAQIRLRLVHCYRALSDNERLIKTCADISCCLVESDAIRHAYFQEMLKVLAAQQEVQQEVALEDCFSLVTLTVESPTDEPIIVGSILELSLEMDSRFPFEVHCSRVEILLEDCKDAAQMNLKIQTLRDQRVMIEHLDYKEDKSLSSASVIAKNPKEFLRRKDSSNVYKKAPITPIKKESSVCVVKRNVRLQPGVNKIVLEHDTSSNVGFYRVCQVVVVISEKMSFLSTQTLPLVSLHVVSQEMSIQLNKGEKDLLTGLFQEMVLTVKTGSKPIDEDSVMSLSCSRGLKMGQEKLALSRDLNISLPRLKPFSVETIVLHVFAELQPQKDSHSVEHMVNLTCPWNKQDSAIPLHFQPPLMTTFRLHTAATLKFAQVVVVGLNTETLHLSEPELTCLDKQVTLTPLNPVAGQKLVVGDNINVSFLWQLEVGNLDGLTSIKLVFAVMYTPSNEEARTRPYRCLFDVTNYKTLFEVGTRVEPTKGSGEFCRAGTMCHLLLSVEGVNESSHNSLMYEVLADQAMWAVCGRTAGVITLDSLDKQTVTLDVMPLIGGFLPLPLVRLSKYLPATDQNNHPRLEPFSVGQVYNSSKSQQVHVLPSITPAMMQSDTNLS